jgi:hypothetical protein
VAEGNEKQVGKIEISWIYEFKSFFCIQVDMMQKTHKYIYQDAGDVSKIEIFLSINIPTFLA